MGKDKLEGGTRDDLIDEYREERDLSLELATEQARIDVHGLIDGLARQYNMHFKCAAELVASALVDAVALNAGHEAMIERERIAIDQITKKRKAQARKAKR